LLQCPKPLPGAKAKSTPLRRHVGNPGALLLAGTKASGGVMPQRIALRLGHTGPHRRAATLTAGAFVTNLQKEFPKFGTPARLIRSHCESN